MLVKFSTLGGGCFIEVSDHDEIQDSDRCFRFDRKGYAEWAYVKSVKEDGNWTLWYGHNLTQADFSFA